MEKPDDSKRGQEPVDDQRDLPAYDLTPNQMLSTARRRTVLFWILVGSFAAFAVIFALSEAERNSGKQDFSEKLNVTKPQPAGPPVRVVPPLPMSAQELREDPFTNRTESGAVSAERMAAAMAAVREAKQYMDVRNWDAAESQLTNAVAIWPEMTLAMRLRGVIFTQRGQFDEAVTILERVLKKDPFNAETYNTLATACIQKKQFERAEQLLQTAISIRPDYPASEVNLGLLYVLTKRYDVALEHLLAAVPAMPDNGAVQNNIAVCYMRLNRMDEARERLQALIAKNPKHVGAYFNLAMTYSMQNDTTNAIAWIRKGSAQCTPVDVQRFLTDPDFESLRDKKEYQDLIRELYPQLPPGPGA